MKDLFALDEKKGRLALWRALSPGFALRAATRWQDVLGRFG